MNGELAFKNIFNDCSIKVAIFPTPKAELFYLNRILCAEIPGFILSYYKKSLTFRITESIMAYRCKGGIAYGQNGASEVGYN